MIKFEVQGLKELERDLKARSEKVKDEMRSSIERLCILLVARIKDRKLSGQVLNRKTGQLSRSIRHRVEEQPNGVVGQVGSALKYARAQEFGFVGAVAVRAHSRTIKEAFGEPITPRQIIVGAHSRNMKLPERSFLRSSLKEMQPLINRELTNAVGRAVK